MASLRETLGSVLDGDDGGETAVETPVSDDFQQESVENAPQPVETEPLEPVDNSVDKPEGGAVRDALGRFVPKDVSAAAPAAPPAAADPAAAPAQTPAEALNPPPVSWRAEVKAEWGKLPPTVQAEVMRRETEVQRVLSESGSARSIANQFTERVTPYMPFIRAEGLNNPLDAFAGLMDTHVALKTGSAFQKAEKLAGLVKHYGIDIIELDKALAGVAQEKPEDVIQRQVQALVSQQLQPVMQLKQQLEAERQAKLDIEAKAADGEMRTFAQKNPHFETVRSMMADIMEVSERNGGGVLSLQDAYDRAVLLHPSLRGATLAAQTAQTAQQLNAAAQRAKAAARAGRVQPQSSSVTQGGAGRKLSLRDAISTAMQDVPLA